jgi:putative DNA methylase
MPDGQFQLPLTKRDAMVPGQGASTTRAIEDSSFPFETLSDIAEAESWRKEIHRPIYHMHKWWARRLGTVFRATVLGALAQSGSDVLRLFYEPVRFPGAVVFDPFMGSGTTIGEALKLGARAIGRDINPVAEFLVRNALSPHDRRKVHAAFEDLERNVAPLIRRYYEVRMPDGRSAEALYYFWVKTLPCPKCDCDVDLFASRIFAQHTYPRRFPNSQASCPHCDQINEVSYDCREALCKSCRKNFNPQNGPSKGQKAECARCNHVFPIAKTIQSMGHAPVHRMYAKLVLTPEGNKEYLATDDFDRALYVDAESALSQRERPYPVVKLEEGYNTNQAIKGGYLHWHEFFNARQLLCLSILADGIRAIGDRATRELFTCLFSGALEFNNMFASFKGEGTGAVRHMFAHHILKPERTPLEANLWGTPSSSGSFSTLYASRILRALGYAAAPTEIRVDGLGGKATKVWDLSQPLGFVVADTFKEFEANDARLYLSCGDSSGMDIPNGSVDAVVTDPPFYDNVHYSQLADFFHVWQRHLLGDSGTRRAATTRATGEVQDENGAAFTDKLANVLCEARRILKNSGLLVFTYHHSRQEGWSAVLDALMRSGLRVVAAHPIKSEMSVAMPKNLAKEPIDLDIIMVCRKVDEGSTAGEVGVEMGGEVASVAAEQIAKLTRRGRKLSRNDVRVIVMAQALRYLTMSGRVDAALGQLAAWEREAEALITKLHVWPAQR